MQRHVLSFKNVLQRLRLRFCIEKTSPYALLPALLLNTILDKKCRSVSNTLAYRYSEMFHNVAPGLLDENVDPLSTIISFSYKH
jgi:hypothetical protein